MNTFSSTRAAITSPRGSACCRWIKVKRQDGAVRNFHLPNLNSIWIMKILPLYLQSLWRSTDTFNESICQWIIVHRVDVARFFFYMGRKNRSWSIRRLEQRDGAAMRSRCRIVTDCRSSGMVFAVNLISRQLSDRICRHAVKIFITSSWSARWS